MELMLLLRCMKIMCIICIGSYVQKAEGIPVSNSTVITPVATSQSALSEYLQFNSGERRDVKSTVFSKVLDNQLKDKTTDEIDVPDGGDYKKLFQKNLISTFVVPYVCDIERGMCWLKETQENLVTLLIPIKLLPNKQPPPEIGLKEFYSLVAQRKIQQQDDPTNIKPTKQAEDTTSYAHPRRRRDTRYAADNGNYQQDWNNEREYENEQSPRVQRDTPNNYTEQVITSTDAVTQTPKQSKRSAEMDDDEVDDADANSPSPDDEYQDENDMDYRPEKRYAGPETTDATTKTPSQPIRRSANSRNNNNPYFANPDYYFPSQRMMSPFDGIGYRSVDAMPMMYMNPFAAAFWQTKFARSPQQYYQQPQTSGYGRGWPSMSNYYNPYANRYQPSYQNPNQQNRGHYHRQFQQQQSHRPYSYNYAQGNRNYQAPAKKPVETDANMYYGK